MSLRGTERLSEKRESLPAASAVEFVFTASLYLKQTGGSTGARRLSMR